jgi:ApbE superfamily uncharacterized protein (UPF0280 family)
MLIMDNNSLTYCERTYRNRILKNKFNVYNVTIRETDLFINTDTNLEDCAYRSADKYRTYLETYINKHPLFLKSLIPLAYDPFAPRIVRDMMAASSRAAVGPMAAVAGAIADHVGKDLRQYSRNVIIENGGDVFIDTQNDLNIGIFAGHSTFSEKISLLVYKEEMPLGICTSSGTVGHSLSFGKADAVCVKATSAALADAAATAIGNRVKAAHDIPQALEEGMMILDVLGIVIIMNDHLGAVGNMKLTRK